MVLRWVKKGMAKRPTGRKRFVKKQKNLISKVNKIYKMIETKQIAYLVAGVSPISTTTGTRYILNLPNNVAQGSGTTPNITMSTTAGQQGVGGYQRIGNKISITEFSFTTAIGLTSATQSRNVRMLVYIEKNPEGVSTASNELFIDNGAGLTVYSPLKYISSKRFIILKDKLYDCKLQGGASDQIDIMPIKYRHKFKTPLVTEYYPDTTATTIAGIQRNAIYVFFVADAGNTATQNLYSSILYKDA